MFAASIPSVEYADPWAQSFEQRLALLKRGSPRAAYYYALPDTSTYGLVLRRPIGGKQVLREQIEHLIEACRHRYFRLQVMPVRSGGHAAAVIQQALPEAMVIVVSGLPPEEVDDLPRDVRLVRKGADLERELLAALAGQR